MQWTCLLLCVASIFVQNSLLSAYLLMAGVATSRLGLWTFDLSVIQQMQVGKTLDYKTRDSPLKANCCFASCWWMNKLRLFFKICLNCFLSHCCSWIGSCSWIWSLCCGRCSELTAVNFGFDDLRHGNIYLWHKGDLTECCFGSISVCMCLEEREIIIIAFQMGKIRFTEILSPKLQLQLTMLFSLS